MSASKFLLCAADSLVGWLCCSSIRSLVPSSTPQCQPMPPVAVSSHHATDLSSWNSLKVSLCLCLSLCVSVSSVSLCVSVFSLLCIYPSINTLNHPSIHPPTHIMYIHPSNHGALTLTSINRSAMAHTHTHSPIYQSLCLPYNNPATPCFITPGLVKKPRYNKAKLETQ